MRGVELIDLIDQLRHNPASRFQAAIANWTHPVSREAMAQMDIADLMLMRWAGNKYKPLPRPWDHAITRKGKSPAAAMRQLRPHLFADS